MTAEPLVRASFCREWLALIALEDEPYRTRFFERIPPEMRARIDRTSRVAWLPFSIHVKLADIMLEAFGAARAYDYYRRSFVISVKGPVFGPLVMTGLRLFGASPASFIRWASRGYEAGFKNVGEIVGQSLGPGRGRLDFLNLPVVCTASNTWVMAVLAHTYGIYDLLGVNGFIRLDTDRLAEGMMRFDLEWSEVKSSDRSVGR